jgi:hypothetical protein
VIDFITSIFIRFLEECRDSERPVTIHMLSQAEPISGTIIEVNEQNAVILRLTPRDVRVCLPLDGMLRIVPMDSPTSRMIATAVEH